MKQPSSGDHGKAEGWKGWDDYAHFYDWENAQTLDRRDVRFWQRMALRAGGPVLELGCGTGRVTIPVARTGARVVGVDRSVGDAPLRAETGEPCATERACFVASRATSAALPFCSPARFSLVMAPYGILQSLVSDSDLKCHAGVGQRVLAPGGVFGLDLVPDLPVWKEYRGRVRFRGSRRGGRARITLVESVRQDRAKKLTMFDQEYIEQRGAERKVAPVLAGIPHVDRSADDAPARACRISHPSRARRLQRRAVGSAGRCVADSRRKE